MNTLISIIATSLLLVSPGTAYEQNSMINDESKIVIIGASYAASWPIKELSGMIVVNAGIGGNQSFEMLDRFGSDVVAARPKRVLIWGFINDLFRSDPTQMDATEDRIKKSFVAMTKTASDQGIEVIVGTEVLMREPPGFLNWVASIVGGLMGKTSYQQNINRQVSELNDWLRAYAKSQEILVLDFESLLSDSDGQRKSEFATADGSHLTPDAYAAMTKYARQVLDANYQANEVDTAHE